MQSATQSDNSFDLVETNAEVKHGVRLGLKLAADFLYEYDEVSNHKYRLGDCLLAKFGIIDKSEMRPNRRFGMDQVISVVAHELDTTTAAILSRSRLGPISRARHLCCYLGHKVVGIGPNEIARALRIDHTSALYGVKQGRRLHTGIVKAWRQTVNKIIKELEA